MALRPCESAHCSGADPEINEICKKENWPVNHPVLTRDSQGVCYCSCSCLAFGTPVQVSAAEFTAVERIEVNDQVLAAGLDLKWTPKTVVFSQGTTGVSRQKYTVLITYDLDIQTALAVTSDHIFLLSDGSLITADRLTTNHTLTTPNGKPIRINSVHIGDYTAGFHHIATSKRIEDDNLSGHFINTNGVVSGDYTLQLHYRDKTLQRHLTADFDTLATVGMPEYIAKFGDECQKSPTSNTAHIEISKSNIKEMVDQVFIPSSQTIIVIPENACSFISDEEAEAKQLDKMRPWNDPLSREWTEYLIQHHRRFYPNIIYHLDWADNTVNAYAWVENGVRHVAIKGGLVRHWALELEGIALVLAHELAHHLGGIPTFPGGLSCEGQADYFGVRNIMRNVWFGEQYISVTDKAIYQMANFFGVPNTPNLPGGSAGCNHPAGACRIGTYYAAVNLNGKPTCAS